MKNLICALGMTLAVAGCTATERGAVTGGAIGAGVGALATGDVEGAVVGGAVGAVAGALIGRASEPGDCVYRDSRGNRFVDRCPDGY